MKSSQYLGKVCDKHASLEGLRYRKNRVCIGCLREIQAERQRRVEGYPALLEEVEALRAMHGDAADVLRGYMDKLAAMASRAHEAEQEAERLRGVKRQLGTMKAAALKVYRGRDPEDDRIGNPSHAHTKPGHWDRDGSPCKSCADWDRMAKLARQK